MGLLKCVVILCLTLIASILGSDLNNILTLSLSSTEVSQFVNSSLIVFCKSKNRDADVQWYSPMGIIVQNVKGRVHIEGRPDQLALVFERIALIDKGQWTCQATVNDNDYRRSFDLFVNQQIIFDDFAQIQSVEGNRDATVFCRTHGDPKPTITWYRNGDLIKFPNSKFKQLSDGIFIKAVTKADTGEYTCRAFQISERFSDIQEKTIQLRIQYEPLWMRNETTREYYTHIGGFISISCDVLAEPEPYFTWYFNNETIRNHNNSDYRIFRDVYSSVLQINVQNETQFGEYKCKASNLLGSLEREFQLLESSAKKLFQIITLVINYSLILSIFLFFLAN